MRIYELLDDSTRKQLNATSVHSSNKPNKTKHHERLTSKELNELMEVNKQIYTRKRGRVRSK